MCHSTDWNKFFSVEQESITVVQTSVHKFTLGKLTLNLTSSSVLIKCMFTLSPNNLVSQI